MRRNKDNKGIPYLTFHKIMSINKHTLPILLFILLFVFAGSGCRKQVIERYPDGNVFAINHIKYPFGHGEFDGENKLYYENGHCKAEAYYRNGKVQGLIKSYYDNGNKCNFKIMKDNVKNGYDSMWHRNGTLKYSTFNINGTIHGAYLEWDSLGILRISTNYLNGIENGVRHIWYTNGEYSEARYVNGLPDGTSRIWHKNGSLETIGIFSSGKPCGIAYSYNTTGRLMDTKNHGLSCDTISNDSTINAKSALQRQKGGG